MTLENYANKIDHIVVDLAEYVGTQDDKSLDLKKSEDKWSKKEIIGHLIDSSLANWKRFSEIQFMGKPYEIRSYNQVSLVEINAYQQMDVSEILNTCVAINKQISHMLIYTNPKHLEYEVIIKNDTKPFDFLISDYIAHLEHHIRQIKE